MNQTAGAIAATGVLLFIIIVYIFFSIRQNRISSGTVTPNPTLTPTPTAIPDLPSTDNTSTLPVQSERVKPFRDGTWYQFKTLMFLAPENWRVVNSTETDVIWMQPLSVSDPTSLPRIQISFSRPLEDLEYVSISERYFGYEDYPEAKNSNSRITSAYQAQYPNYSSGNPIMIQNRAALLQKDGDEFTIFYQYQAEEGGPESEQIFIELLESLRYR